MNYDSSGYKSKKHSDVYSSDNEDSYSTYSEDFEDDSRTSSYENLKKSDRHHHSKKHSKKLGQADSSSNATMTLSSDKKSAQSEGRKRSTKQVKLGWRSNSFSKDSKKKQLAIKDTVQARMVSARRNRINILSNELSQVQSKLDDVTKENKLLKTLQHRQDRALRRFEDTENDLPRLISQHSEDQRVLKARLRKSQEAERVLENKLHTTNEEMTKMENTLKRLKKMVYDRNLGERSELSRQLSLAEDKLYDVERKNKELEKKLELTTSSYMRQINTERGKHKETKERLDILHEDYQAMQTKLKEKERALEVSNIYALRSKQTPEKSFVGGKVGIFSPRRITDKPTRQDPSPLPLVPGNPPAEIEPRNDPKPPSPPAVTQPKPHIAESLNHVTDFRKTMKSPEESRKSPKITDSMELQDISKQLNGLKLPSQESDWKSKEDDKRGKSVFLTANFESPTLTPSSTFISEKNQPMGNPLPQPPVTTNQMALFQNDATISPNQREENKFQTTQTLSNGFSVSEEIKRKEMQVELEKKKLEEDRKKKAALLARIKDVEENDSSGTPGGNKSDDPIRQLLSNGNTTQHNPKVENLHLGIPSKIEQTKKSDPELSFGGYAPTIAPPKRKPARGLTHQKKPATPSGSESDEPMLDLVSGKSKKPDSDLLANLFPGQAKSKLPEQSFQREPSKTTPCAKPVHSGYPWERNVVPASQHGNGDAKPSNQRAGNIYTSPLVKAAPSNDDIEELIL